MLKRFITGSILSFVLLTGIMVTSQMSYAAEGVVSVGRYNTMLSIGAGTNTKGPFLSGSLLYTYYKGNTFDLGFGYNMDIRKSFRLYPSVKVVFSKYEESTNGTKMSLAIGTGIKYFFDSYWSIYSQYHYGLECFSIKKNPNSYHALHAGVQFKPISKISLEAGYRYIILNNNNAPSSGYASIEYLAKSPYLGISVLF
ncbi:hypothetical protein CRV09_01615 [Candidatus Pantoea edessiphila]|uniref:Outer membrane protein beta-barrel domain-containing protein n=1 Tax=Candidatus Pantoea edessiphila TaxID=2044610 RepID=A0A2P5T1W6_9GAMM|nr:YfaZ family outer membrane protein [Candidatus Pantoea edessiphila]PPI88585.1 hypothetical protein CRV09_01615 [Candidatus Pantoea edessiphila]